MIRLGPYRFTNWQAVKINWKRGVRGPVSGHAVKGGIKTYEIGEGFILYPHNTHRWDGDICSLEPDPEDTQNTGGPYRSDYSILSPSGNGIF